MSDEALIEELLGGSAGKGGNGGGAARRPSPPMPPPAAKKGNEWRGGTGKRIKRRVSMVPAETMGRGAVIALRGLAGAMMLTSLVGTYAAFAGGFATISFPMILAAVFWQIIVTVVQWGSLSNAPENPRWYIAYGLALFFSAVPTYAGYDDLLIPMVAAWVGGSVTIAYAVVFASGVLLDILPEKLLLAMEE
jgi:hypothetical protein